MITFKPINNLGSEWYTDIAQKLIVPIWFESFKPFVYELVFLLSYRSKKYYQARVHPRVKTLYKPLIIFKKGVIRVLQLLSFEISLRRFRKRIVVLEEDLQFKSRKKEFEVGKRYESLLAMLLICYPFTGLIPFMNILIFVSVSLSAILHKIILLHFAKVKHSLDNRIIKFCIGVFKVSFLLKLCVNMVFFPRNEIFPEDRSLLTFLNIEPILNLEILRKHMRRGRPHNCAANHLPFLSLFRRIGDALHLQVFFMTPNPRLQADALQRSRFGL